MNGIIIKGFFKTAELASLHEKWRIRVARIVSLNSTLEETNRQDKRSLSFMYRLEKVLDQISFFKKKELDVIREIEAIEQKHHFMREHNMLRKAGDEKKARNKMMKEEDAYEDEEKPRSMLGAIFWLWLFAKLTKSNTARRQMAPE